MKRLMSFTLAALVSTVSLRGANIYWVSFHPGENTPDADAASAGFTMAPDAGYTQLLTANGHNVIRYQTTPTPDVALLNSADLIILSRSVGSGDYQDDPETAAWNGITAPMIIINGYLLRNSRLGFVTGATIPDTVGTVTLEVKDPSHPIFSGVSLNPDNTMVSPYAESVSFNGTTQRGISVNTDPLAGNGKLLAAVATPGDPAFGGMVIAEWEAGAVLATSPADTLGGHRLAFLTGSREASGLTSHGAGIYDLTPEGAKMFLNAVNYMAVPEPSTIALVGLGGLAIFLLRRRV